MFKVNNKDTRTTPRSISPYSVRMRGVVLVSLLLTLYIYLYIIANFIYFSVYIVNFEHVNADWAGIKCVQITRAKCNP